MFFEHSYELRVPVAVEVTDTITERKKITIRHFDRAFTNRMLATMQ